MGDIGKLRAHWSSGAPVRGNAAERSPESVAEVLRNARLLQGYSLREVASALNIREAHLNAIEDAHFEELPPLVYAQGFVAAYAGFLNLDRSEMVTRFKDEATATAPVQTAVPRLVLPSLAEDDTPERRMAPSGRIIALAVLVLLVAYGAWHIGSPPAHDAALDVPPLPERFLQAPPALPTATLPTSASTTTSAAEPVYVTPTAATSDHIISVTAKTETWVQLHNQAGQRVASFVLKVGEGYTLPAGAYHYTLSTSNMANLQLSIDGQPIATPNLTGREWIVDADALLAAQR